MTKPVHPNMFVEIEKEGEADEGLATHVINREGEEEDLETNLSDDMESSDDPTDNVLSFFSSLFSLSLFLSS